MDRESLKAWFVNGGILGFVTMAEAEAAMKVALLALTILYTLRRWFLTERGRKEDAEIVKRMEDL
jgi:hypothetical protein